MVPIIRIFNRSDLSSSLFVSLVMANECEEPVFWLMEFSHRSFDTSKRSKVRLRSKDLRLYTPTQFTPTQNDQKTCLWVWNQEAGSLKMNTSLEHSTRVVQEGGLRCKKSTLNDLVHLTPLRIPLMNPPRVSHKHILYLLVGSVCPTTVRTRNKEWVQHILPLSSARSLADLCKFSRHF